MASQPKPAILTNLAMPFIHLNKYSWLPPRPSCSSCERGHRPYGLGHRADTSLLREPGLERGQGKRSGQAHIRIYRSHTTTCTSGHPVLGNCVCGMLPAYCPLNLAQLPMNKTGVTKIFQKQLCRGLNRSLTNAHPQKSLNYSHA